MREGAFRAAFNVVGPRYFDTLGVLIVARRDFDERDRKGTPAMAIVNRTLARRLFPHGDAVGRALLADGQTSEVVGVGSVLYGVGSRDPAALLAAPGSSRRRGRARERPAGP